MTPNSQALLREALSLDDDERADLAAELLASLDAPDSVKVAEAERLWAEEIDRRGRSVVDGDPRGEAWATVRQRVTEHLAQG